MDQYRYWVLRKGSDEPLDTFSADQMFSDGDIDGDVGRFNIDGEERQCKLTKLDPTPGMDGETVILGTIWVQPTGIEEY